MPNPFPPDLPQPLPLPQHDTWPASKHEFDDTSRWAVRSALAARRPLLLRGEPGIGKSQLARAVAVAFKVPFLYHVVDERSERDDLLYTYDAVSRLAQAQVSGLAAQGSGGQGWQELVAERNFIRPGVLWWAFDWSSALAQAERFARAGRKCQEPTMPDGWTPASERPCGPVVLVDEIDKADPSVPNGLLESLGNEGFQTAQLGEAIRLPEDAKPPLVIITTNEERELPAAFLRRCLVLQMRFPSDPDKARAFLHARARVFWDPSQVSDTVCNRVIDSLLADRSDAVKGSQSIPGAAEFLDLIKVLAELHSGDDKEQLKCLDLVKDFALRKNLTDAP